LNATSFPYFGLNIACGNGGHRLCRCHSHAYTHGGAYCNPNTHSYSYGGGHTYAYTNISSYTDANAGTNAHSNSCADANADALAAEALPTDRLAQRRYGGEKRTGNR
jgi:hypothetical protein